MKFQELPVPPHFEADKVDQVWRVPYQERAETALQWVDQHQITSAFEDEFKLGLILVDVQNTFCLPDFELYVGGRSGSGAVDDNRRLCEFIYRNLGTITQVSATLDTHQAIQIFHALFLVDSSGNHPDPMTMVSVEDVENGRWKFNPAVANSLGISVSYGQQFLLHYTQRLKAKGKYDLTIWPYHAMLGGIGHALVASVEEAIFFHAVARYSQPDFVVKGGNPLTEHYSAIGPEVLTGPNGAPIAERDGKFIKALESFDAVAIAGQAKSHCVAWTIDDLLTGIRAQDERLVEKVYLLEDCTSPVVIPRVVDFTDEADEAFRRFAEAGMHIVRSTDQVAEWPGIGG
jgi:nicotinamidase-related amidase